MSLGIGMGMMSNLWSFMEFSVETVDVHKTL